MPASDNIVIVDGSRYMRNTFKGLLSRKQCDIYEAGDESSALKQVSAHRPKVVFVSMESKYWPGLVQKLKEHDCIVVAYCNRVTSDALASAFFAGVDDILVNPLEQKERVEKYLIKGSFQSQG